MKFKRKTKKMRYSSIALGHNAYRPNVLEKLLWEESATVKISNVHMSING